MKKGIISLGIFLSLLSFISCSKKEAAAPCYLEISEMDVQSDFASQGSESDKIQVVWIYVNDQLNGVYELPATIPVIEQGLKEIKIGAGIRDNGQSTNFELYPFLDWKTVELNLVPGETILIHDEVLSTSGKTLVNPVNYFPNLNFWIEDFENPGFNFDKHSTSDTTIIRSATLGNPFEGGFSGFFYLDQTNNYFRYDTDEQFNFDNSNNIYLELNYRCNTPLDIYITASNVTGSLDHVTYQFYSTEDENGNIEWKKSYLNLTPIIKNEVNAESFELSFRMSNYDNIPDAEGAIDNIKIIY